MAVHRRSRVERIQFRKLPNGAVYYQTSDGNGPFVKSGRTTKLTANTAPTVGGSSQTTVSDVSIITNKVTKFALKAQRAI